MKVAVAINGNTLEDLVAEEFEKSACLLIVETDDLSYEVYQNQEQIDGSGLAMAQKVFDEDCEALISGSIEKLAFEIIADAYITRYLGANYPAKIALELMENNQLELIQEYNGKEWDPNNCENDFEYMHAPEECTCGAFSVDKDSNNLGSYTDIAIEHFMCPRNIGNMVNADGEGTFGDPECGDSLTVFIKVENKIIKEISYLVFGCPGSVVTSSMTSVLAKGKTLEEAQNITEEDVIEALGGLPEHKRHCSLLGVQALRKAIDDYNIKSKNININNSIQII